MIIEIALDLTGLRPSPTSRVVSPGLVDMAPAGDGR
jgi:hypothetical protein